MKIKTLTTSLIIIGFLFSLIAEEGKNITVKLKPGRWLTTSYTTLLMNEKNGGSFEFPTPSGKLLYKIEKNKLFLDINDDGKIDKSDGNGVKHGNYIKVPIKTHNIELDYAIHLSYTTRIGAHISGATTLEGELNGKTIIVMDSNLNGKFNDFIGDKIWILRDNPWNTPLTPHISVNGKIYNLSFSEDKPELTLKPYKGDIGKVKLQAWEYGWDGNILLSKEDGSFMAVINSKKKIDLIPGVYRVFQTQYLNGKQDDRKTTRLLGRKTESIIINKGKNIINIGHPFQLKFKASKSKDDVTKLQIDEAYLVDQGGFVYNARTYYFSEKQSLKVFIKAGDRKKAVAELEYDGKKISENSFRIPEEFSGSEDLEVGVEFKSSVLGDFTASEKVKNLEFSKPPLSSFYQETTGKKDTESVQKSYLKAYEKALEFYNDDPNFLNTYAWMLVNHPNEKLHAPEKGLKLAKEAVKLSGGRDGKILETLAVAYYRNGRLEKAVETINKALQLSGNNQEIYRRAVKYRKELKQKTGKNK